MFGRRPADIHLPTKPDPDARPKPEAPEDIRDTSKLCKFYDNDSLLICYFIISIS